MSAPPSTADFFAALYGDDPRGELVLWRLSDKRSSWGAVVDAHDRAARFAEADLYFGLALQERPAGLVGPGPHSQRGEAEHARMIPGLWLDVDLGKRSSGSSYPPDAGAARILLAECGLAPSIEVASGSGLHLYWLFREPWSIDSAADRRSVADLSASWQAWWREEFASKGWALDATGDLARVLRVPGTFNAKRGARQPVIIQNWRPDLRYSLSDFELYQSKAAPAMAAPVAIGDLVLSAAAQPPASKLEALLALEPTFRLSWEHRRSDLTDSSPSSYDFSLAVFAATFDWTDQEIADLLIAFRERHGLPKKASASGRLRADYYAATIARARGRVQAPRALAAPAVSTERSGRPTSADSQAPALVAAEARRQRAGGADVEQAFARASLHAGGLSAAEVRSIVLATYDSNKNSPDERLADLSAELGVDVVGIVKRGAEGGIFELLLRDGGSCTLGPVADVANPRRVSERIADQRSVWRRHKPQKWDEFANAIITLAVVDQTSDPNEELEDWLIPFAKGAPDLTRAGAEARWKAFGGGWHHGDDRWFDGDDLFLRVEPFLQHISVMARSRTPSRNELLARLQRLNAAPAQPSVRFNGSVQKVRTWRIPGFRSAVPIVPTVPLRGEKLETSETTGDSGDTGTPPRTLAFPRAS